MIARPRLFVPSAQAGRGHAQKTYIKYMKITEAKVFVSSPGRNFVTLKIYTDEGLYGLGDATLNGREKTVASYLEDYCIPCLIGKDPFNI